jgi:predicted transcriptional regulator
MNAFSTIAAQSAAPSDFLPLLVTLSRYRLSEILVLCALPAVKIDDIAARVHMSPSRVCVAMRGLCAAGLANAINESPGMRYEITAEGAAFVLQAMQGGQGA